MSNNSLKCNKCDEGELVFDGKAVFANNGALFTTIDVIRCNKCSEEYSKINIIDFLKNEIKRLDDERKNKEKEVVKLKKEIKYDLVTRDALMNLMLKVSEEKEQD